MLPQLEPARNNLVGSLLAHGACGASAACFLFHNGKNPKQKKPAEECRIPNLEATSSRR
jgi:hypothetical protein